MSGSPGRYPFGGYGGNNNNTVNFHMPPLGGGGSTVPTWSMGEINYNSPPGRPHSRLVVGSPFLMGSSSVHSGGPGTPATRRIRANTTQSYQRPPVPPASVIAAATPAPAPAVTAASEQNRSRSSSWPRPPPPGGFPGAAPSPPLQHAQRTRSGNRSSTSSKGGSSTPSRNKGNDSPNSSTPRKKRKRLNPQRRSFYKSLHSDFPDIADALREARQGADVIQTLQSREIFYSPIEARPPQDPTNLNVRRYNDMVFIWDPAMETWLQVPGNGRMPDLESSSGGPNSFAAFGETGNPPADFPLQRVTSTTSGDRQRSDGADFLFSERSFISDTSTSEDEDYFRPSNQPDRAPHSSRPRPMSGFLPTDLFRDF